MINEETWVLNLDVSLFHIRQSANEAADALE